MEKFIESYAFIAALVVMIVEFLVAKSKIKSNSIIEVVMTILKFVFRLEKKEELELPKE